MAAQEFFLIKLKSFFSISLKAKKKKSTHDLEKKEGETNHKIQKAILVTSTTTPTLFFSSHIHNQLQYQGQGGDQRS